MTNTLRAAAVQFEHAAGDKRREFRQDRIVCAGGRADRVQLLVFPECCITGYWFFRNFSREEFFALAEPVPAGPSTQRLLALAREHRMTIGAGLVESDGERLFNSYVVAMPDGQYRCHRKIQAFESEHISAGSEYTVFDTPHGVRVGALICYDNNIIENVRITALAGAQVLLAPHQTGGTDSLSPHGMKPIDPKLWHDRHANPGPIRAEILGRTAGPGSSRWLPSRAHDNGMFLIFANGIGIDDNEVRTGNAMILDPYGRVLVETNEPADAMVVADLDLSLIPHSTGRRWLRTRRPDLYGPLATPTGLEQPTRAVRLGSSDAIGET